MQRATSALAATTAQHQSYKLSNFKFSFLLQQDQTYMRRCLQLAQMGFGSVAPNPSVGCVIVHKDKIIGEGYTSPYGGNHAEVNAINSVENQALLKKATLYVSLEPCAHFGKTPPCANLIIEKKIKRVIIACLDSFAQVNGLGIKRLMEAGVDVKIGVLEQEAHEQNRRFFTFHQKKRPYIILKWAETTDGFVDHFRTAPNQTALKITAEPANILVHKWRAQEAAIMVGKNTALNDNPSLTTRKYEGKNPIRILIDGKLETPAHARIFSSDATTLIFTESAKPELKSGTLQSVVVDDVHHLPAILTELYQRNIQSVIVEGGPTLHASFYNAGLWDEIRRFVSPKNAVSGIRALSIEHTPTQQTKIGVDQLFIYRNR